MVSAQLLRSLAEQFVDVISPSDFNVLLTRAKDQAWRAYKQARKLPKGRIFLMKIIEEESRHVRSLLRMGVDGLRAGRFWPDERRAVARSVPVAASMEFHRVIPRAP